MEHVPVFSLLRAPFRLLRHWRAPSPTMMLLVVMPPRRSPSSRLQTDRSQVHRLRLVRPPPRRDLFALPPDSDIVAFFTRHFHPYFRASARALAGEAKRDSGRAIDRSAGGVRPGEGLKALGDRGRVGDRPAREHDLNRAALRVKEPLETGRHIRDKRAKRIPRRRYACSSVEPRPACFPEVDRSSPVAVPRFIMGPSKQNRPHAGLCGEEFV